MHLRSLPAFPDLPAYLAHLDGRGEVTRIAAQVSVRLEATEIHRRVIASAGPVLHFERPVDAAGKAFAMPLLANLFGTRTRVAAGLGIEPGDLGRFGTFLAALRAPEPPASLGDLKALLPVARAGLAARPKTVVRPPDLRAAPVDLSALPVQTCWPGDAGPLITWGMVVTRPPGPDDPRRYNLGIYRMQVLGPDRAILRWLPMRGGAQHHREWAALGEPMPVAVVIGCDPATLLSAVIPAPEGVGELALAGIVNGRRSRVMPCRTIGLHVPDSAEIVLEGLVQPGLVALEGPFGDHTGYYNDPDLYPVLRLSAIDIRDGAAYLSTFTGRAPDEPSVIGAAMTDVFAPLLRQAVPEILDVHLPPETCSYRMAVLQVDKRYPGQARRAMLAFWSLLPQFSMTKYVIVVDRDIDIRSWPDVMWAVATRADPERDLVVLARTPVDQLDFASPLVGLGGKLGIDATVKIGTETARAYAQRLAMPRDVVARVDRRWDELFTESAVLRAQEEPA
ncbi:UbiD family decarboxylase [Polymorphum gilvum]|uniref:3-octaprenyl-4-hydroxybenzoate carboxy-lyase subfamily n=1 Tax=Polymorphum gilvum (strain LMG 25793 / CGMCC 1.9160 / SL003B-26A1) TaxID=991905 RepID=F2J4P8_POLGS|nr:UbiD family decarboxylase [Polymorphum gilvum]ADZ68990.1 3-octaprenyl-4-hydroxybenzoate carboxy-lyase subfamily [Polymorphum gilvum SL003B-26A1]